MKRQLCSLLLLPALACSAFAATPPPEKLLAADTVAIFTVPDYAKTRTPWKQWPASQLWADASMKAFKEKFTKKFQSDLIEPLEKEFGIKFEDYSGLAQGQVTLALTPNGWNTDSPK